MTREIPARCLSSTGDRPDPPQPGAGQGRRPARPAAFFDLDKTIIAKSSTLAFSQAVLPRRADQPAGRAAQRLRPVRLPRRRRRPRPDGADARSTCPRCAPGWDVQQVKDIVAETLHDLIDPMVYDEAVDADRGAPRGRPRRRHRQHVRRRGGRADRRDARRRPASSRPGWRRGRPLHRRDRVLRLRPRPRPRRSRELAAERGLRPGPLLRLQRLGHRPADARGGRPPVRRQPGPARCARTAVERGWPVLDFHQPVSLRSRFSDLRPPRPAMAAAAVGSGRGRSRPGLVGRSTPYAAGRVTRPRWFVDRATERRISLARHTIGPSHRAPIGSRQGGDPDRATGEKPSQPGTDQEHTAVGTHAKAVHEWTGRGGLAPLRRRI